MFNNIDTDVLEEVEVKELVKPTPRLVLYNDDYNTFEHVIETLVDVCDHNPLQAEQCALIIHYTGKCAVKEGSFNKLRPMHEAILERGITSKIEN